LVAILVILYIPSFISVSSSSDLSSASSCAVLHCFH
jgi:hypothetical protein